MKRLVLAAIVAMAASEPAWAQSSTGTGLGVARSTSNSQAISGQGGTGLFNTATPAVVSQADLLLTITLNPTTDKTAAPTLVQWEVKSDCIPSE